MAQIQKPAALTRSGLLGGFRLAAVDPQNAPNLTTDQRKSRRLIREAGDLTGADAYAAVALAQHFAGRAGAGAAHV
jgi:hypothetical protein